MTFENSTVIGVPCGRLWTFLSVIPNVGMCLPGVTEVRALDDGTFAGGLELKVGIVKLRLAGKLAIELMDERARVARLSVSANDPKISGMIQGKITVTLEELSESATKLTVATDVSLFGKIGEFGGPIIRRKADAMMAEFAQNVSNRVSAAAVPSA